MSEATIEEIVVDGQEQLKRFDHVVLSPEKWRALIASWRERGEALNQAEAVFSIVEPRSDKAEYLRVLGVVRAALKAGAP